MFRHPYTQYKDAVNRKVHPFDSIAVSGHKFFGMDEPAGIFLTTMEVKQNQNPYNVTYLDGSMPMINCSRSALSPLKLLWIIRKYGDKGFTEQAQGMLERAAWLKAKLDEMGWQAWLEPMSNTVYFKRPPKAIVEKYDLAPDFDARLGGELSHIVVMQHVKLDKLQDGDVLVLAGSIPSVMPSSMYMDIMKHLSDKKLDIVVDATNDLLVNVLQYHPFLIKPNNHELGEIFGVELNTRDEVVPYAKKMQEKGARNVLISMAGEGAVLVTEDGQVFQSKPPKGTVMNSVGAGDSMVAGFVAGYLDSKDYEQAFYMGVCTGSASAFSEELATKDGVSELLKQLGKAYI